MAKNRNHTYGVPTTNLVVHLNKMNLTNLKRLYFLYKIEIPEKFKFSKDRNKYAKLHNTYKNQLDYPYYFYSYADPMPTIFLLVDKSVKEAPALNFEEKFLDCVVRGIKVDFEELSNSENLHILMKLLLSSWFHKNYHTCQSDAFYIYSKGVGKTITALSVNIKSDRDKNTFYIENSATYLHKAEKEYTNLQFVNNDKFYKKLQGEIYYRQVKTSFVQTWKRDKNRKEELWRADSKFDRQRQPNRKLPSIKWFEDYTNYQRCRSNLIRVFQSELVEYYNEVLGDDCVESQSHTMTRVEPLSQFQVSGYGEGTGLYLKLLGEVRIYDNRFIETEYHNTITISEYVDFFNRNYGKKYHIKFKEIGFDELNSCQNPVLVLQDYSKQVFEEEQLLDGYDDPKDDLYRQFSTKVALQTFSVNFNDYSEHSLNTYFGYEMLDVKLKKFGSSINKIKVGLKKYGDELRLQAKAEKKSLNEVSEKTKEEQKNYEEVKSYFDTLSNKIDVCLNELLLKFYLVKNISIKNFDNPNFNLPCILSKPKLTQYSYMYKGFFMYCDKKNVLRFINLDNKQGKEQRNNHLLGLGINWFDIEENFAARNYTRKEGKDITRKRLGKIINRHTNAIRNTHFIFSSGTVLAIEDTNERILHKYDEDKMGKSQRKTEQKTALEGVYYSTRGNVYSVGYKSLNITADDSVHIRKLHYYQKDEDFNMDDILKTLAVEFVRNKQYTVYPYFFDLLNLYRKDILLYD